MNLTSIGEIKILAAVNILIQNGFDSQFVALICLIGSIPYFNILPVTNVIVLYVNKKSFFST